MSAPSLHRSAIGSAAQCAAGPRSLIVSGARIDRPRATHRIRRGCLTEDLSSVGRAVWTEDAEIGLVTVAHYEPRIGRTDVRHSID